MTGGSAWILDEDGTVLSGTHDHAEFLQATSFAEAGEDAKAALAPIVQTA